MPLHAERRGVKTRVWSNRFTLLVGEGGFPRSMCPTNPVGFPLLFPLSMWREGGETRSTATLHTEPASFFPCPVHGERRGGSAQVPSNRFTLLVGEGGFPRSMSPTNPVGFPLSILCTEASTVFGPRGGETRLGPTTCRCRGGETRRHQAYILIGGIGSFPSYLCPTREGET